jgi:hypothetical protein
MSNKVLVGGYYIKELFPPPYYYLNFKYAHIQVTLNLIIFLFAWNFDTLIYLNFNFNIWNFEKWWNCN